MSFDYSTYIITDSAYQDEKILQILKKGHEHGYSFSEYLVEELKHGKMFVNENQALGSLKKHITNKDASAVYLHENKHYSLLHFVNEYGKLTLMFSAFRNPKMKTFENGETEINIAHYAKLLLDLTSDFVIEEMKIEKD